MIKNNLKDHPFSQVQIKGYAWCCMMQLETVYKGFLLPLFHYWLIN